MRDRKKILEAVKALLAPVAGFCLRHGLKVQDVERVLKITLIEAAHRELIRSGKEINNSTVSAATGLSRKFIPGLSTKEALDVSKQDLLTRIVGQWQSDSRFQDSQGLPRALGGEGAESEFTRLVRSVSTDLNSYTLLSEMIRLDLVEKSDNRIVLKAKINIVRKLPEAMELVSQDSEAIQKAAEENILSERPRHLHLTTRYDNIPASSRGEIEGWLLREGSEFHHRAREFLSRFDRDINPKAPTSEESSIEVRLGAFSYIESTNDVGSKKK